MVEQRRQTILRKKLGTSWGNFYIKHGLWPSPSTSVDSNNILRVASHGLEIKEGSPGGEIALRAEFLLDSLRDQGGILMRVDGNELFAELDDLKIRLTNLGDLPTLGEVFLERLYQFDRSGEFVFMDIGANIGLTSLYFASQYEGPIYSFELVPSTAECAAFNFGLNPKHETRITLHTHGLSDKDQKLRIRIDSNDTAGNSIYQQIGDELQPVEVRDAATALQAIVEAHPSRDVVVKLDAEGAEYAILRRWNETSMLRNISILLMEWHQSDRENIDDLRTILRANNFSWFERRHHEAPVGFLTAWKN